MSLYHLLIVYGVGSVIALASALRWVWVTARKEPMPTDLNSSVATAVLGLTMLWPVAVPILAASYLWEKFVQAANNQSKGK